MQLENDDLNTTLKINKDIIQNILRTDAKFDSKVEYTLAQITQENELWENRARILTE